MSKYTNFEDKNLTQDLSLVGLAIAAVAATTAYIIHMIFGKKKKKKDQNQNQN